MVELKDRLTVLDKKYYNNKFVEEFINYFPDIYSKEDLTALIQKEVIGVFLCNGDIEKNVVGGYYTDYKSVILTSPAFDIIAFHEYVHAIRNNYSFFKHTDTIYTPRGFEKHNCDDGIEEAFTEFVSCLYDCRKKQLINSGINNLKVVNKEDDLASYEIIAIIANELQYLAKLMDIDKDLVKIFLSGGNIRGELYQLIKAFTEKLNYNNYYTEKELNKFALEIAYYYMELLLYISNLDIDLVEITYYIEKINRAIGFVLNNFKQSNIIDYSVYKRLFKNAELQEKAEIKKYDMADLNDDTSLIINFLDSYSSRVLVKK